MTQNKFKSFLKLPGGSEIQKCFYPFKLDTYGKGCNHNCLYCYARSTLDFRKLWNHEQPGIADYNKIEKIFKDWSNGKSGKFTKYLDTKIPLRLGGMTDCFMDFELEHQVTYKTLKLLKEYDYPILILTKNKNVALDKYIEVMEPDNTYIQFSISTPFDEVGKVFEPQASLVSERLNSIKKLTDSGFYIRARINPMFPIYPEGYYSENRYQDSKPLGIFDWSLLNKLSEVGAGSVIAGFLRLNSFNIKWIKEQTGKDLKYLFKEQSFKNGALHFGTEEKRYYYEKCKKLRDEQGLRFSICYDGDEDYEEFQYLWANKNDCCDGLNNIKGFKNNFACFRGG